MITRPKSINHYNLTIELGHGAFSTVCKAFNRMNKQSYACKIFPKNNIEKEEDRDRFQREINSMSILRHLSIVSLYDFFADDNNFYLILDLCEGGELKDFVLENGKLEEETASFVLKQIINALFYCHSVGVVHRDLKPENILITNFPFIKISDFGLCQFILFNNRNNDEILNGSRSGINDNIIENDADESNNNILLDSFCGSPCYCSPECLSKVPYDGKKNDIWSVGVILYIMVTGNHPWDVSNFGTMTKQIMSADYILPDYLSEECKDLLTRILKVDQNERISIEKIHDHPFLMKYKNNSSFPNIFDDAVSSDNGKSTNDCLMELLNIQRNENNSFFGIHSPFITKPPDMEADVFRKSDSNTNMISINDVQQMMLKNNIDHKNEQLDLYHSNSCLPLLKVAPRTHMTEVPQHKTKRQRVNSMNFKGSIGVRRFAPVAGLSLAALRQRSDSNLNHSTNTKILPSLYQHTSSSISENIHE